MEWSECYKRAVVFLAEVFGVDRSIRSLARQGSRMVCHVNSCMNARSRKRGSNQYLQLLSEFRGELYNKQTSRAQKRLQRQTDRQAVRYSRAQKGVVVDENRMANHSGGWGWGCEAIVLHQLRTFLAKFFARILFN